MNILITGNNGYIGPVLYKKLKKQKYFIYGLDTNYFNNKNFSDIQFDCDLRNVKKQHFKDIDAIVHLASLSNDPIGNKFNKQTNQINISGTKKIINLAKKTNCKLFIFASSCSVYGKSLSESKSENDPTKPLTPYAKSKIEIENYLKKNSNKNFKSICLRFATACGSSPNLRLDLVLNDFVFSSIIKKKIILKSSGNAWRPLIDVQDMSKAISFFLKNYKKTISNFEIFNVGLNKSNIKIIDLAKIVKKNFKNVKLKFENTKDDKRSYKVNFSKYELFVKNNVKHLELKDTIKNLAKNIKLLKINENNFNQFIRLDVLRKLVHTKKLNNYLKWN